MMSTNKMGFGAICVFVFVMGCLTLGNIGLSRTAPQADNVQLLPNDQFVVRLTAFRAEINRLNRPEVILQVQNKTTSVIRLLKWGTPLDMGKSKPFRIMRNGQPVAYLGVLALRREPTSTDFLEIGPSESYLGRFALDRYYDFSERGLYKLEWDTAIVLGFGSGSKVERYMPVRQTVLMVARESRPKQNPTKEQARMIHRVSQPTLKSLTVGCSSDQKQVLNSARPQGAQLALEMALELRRNSNHSAPRYVNWFGTWDPNRYITTWTTYESTGNVINDPGLNMHCGGDECDPDVIAYVYEPWSFFVWGSGPIRDMYFCPAYWGLDSATRAGVVIHEGSHIVRTDDYEYCWVQSVCNALAQSDPNKATANADSYRGSAQYGAPGGWGPQPDACNSIADCTNGEFCIHQAGGSGSKCMAGPIQCQRNEDCGPGALCVATNVGSMLRMYPPPPGGQTPTQEKKYCVLY